MALNVVPTGESEMSIYAKGNWRYVLRIDGFASVRGPYEGGEVVTKPVVFDGEQIALNLSTAVRGGVRVEIQNSDGEPIKGFTLNDCAPILGDYIERVVSWNGNSDVSKLAGKPVRIRFELRDADIFSYRFQ